MKSAPTYQVVFKCQFQQDISSQPIQIDIVDSNSFVMTKGEKAQLQPYLGTSTPPLANFSVSGQQLYLNVSHGEEDTGMESIVWATFTSAGEAQTLTINLTVSPAISMSYMVMNTSASGSLKAGKNVISISS